MLQFKNPLKPMYINNVNKLIIQEQQIGTENNVSKLITQYARENIAKVQIFLKDPFVKEIVREEKITVSQFVGSIGGLLSLFIGCSLISFVEIIYLLLEWLLSKFNITNAVSDEEN